MMAPLDELLGFAPRVAEALPGSERAPLLAAGIRCEEAVARSFAAAEVAGEIDVSIPTGRARRAIPAAGPFAVPEPARGDQ